MKEALPELWERFTLQKTNPDIDFFESGGDSLSAINLIVELQKKFSVDVSLENFMRNPTLGFLQSLLTEAQYKVC